MKTLIFVLLASLVVGCEQKSSESAAPPASASAAASAPAPSAAAVPSLVASAAPPPSATPAPANVPTEEQYEQKAQTAIATPSAAEAELTKLEKEIGP
jgi:hypothetical protein